MKKSWLKSLNLSEKNGLQQSSFLRIFSLDMEKAFLKNSPQTFSPKAREISTHSPEKLIRRLIFVNYLILSQKFSSTRKMQLWQPCRKVFVKNQHFLAQCLTTFLKSFIFEGKNFTSKFPFGHEECCLKNSAKNYCEKSDRCRVKVRQWTSKEVSFRINSIFPTKFLSDKKKAVLKTMPKMFAVNKKKFFAWKLEKNHNLTLW